MKQQRFLSGGWTVIVPLTGAIGAYLAFLFFPQMREINRLREEIAQKHAYLANAAQHGAREQTIDAETAATLNYVTRHVGDSTAATDVSAVFAEVAERLKAAGVTTTMFRPEAKQVLTSLDRIPLTIGCTGDYASLQSLLSGLERMSHRVWIEEVSFARASENGEGLVCEIKPAIFINKFEISD